MKVRTTAAVCRLIHLVLETASCIIHGRSQLQKTSSFAYSKWHVLDSRWTVAFVVLWPCASGNTSFKLKLIEWAFKPGYPSHFIHKMTSLHFRKQWKAADKFCELITSYGEIFNLYFWSRKLFFEWGAYGHKLAERKWTPCVSNQPKWRKYISRSQSSLRKYFYAGRTPSGLMCRL